MTTRRLAEPIAIDALLGVTITETYKHPTGLCIKSLNGLMYDISPIITCCQQMELVSINGLDFASGSQILDVTLKVSKEDLGVLCKVTLDTTGWPVVLTYFGTTEHDYCKGLYPEVKLVSEVH